MESGTPESSDPPAAASAQPTLWQGLLFEGILLVLAIGLALFVGLQPWAELQSSPNAWMVSVVATVPLILLLVILLQLPFEWIERIMEAVRTALLPMIQRTGLWGIALLSIMAGVGEEFLFRGVIQEWLVSPLGEWGALAVASLLFGAAHFITPAYFILATLMGAYLGLLYIWTGNLLVPVVVHALYDFVALGYYYLRHGASANGSSPPA